MGVYSEAAAMQMRDSQAVESFRFTDLLEFAVNTERNNQNMFNALLELDFQEAVAVQNGGYLTEAGEEKSKLKIKAKFKAVVDRIVSALQKFWNMLKTTLAKIKIKFQEFTGANKKLIKAGRLDAAELEKIATSLKHRKDDLKFTRWTGSTEKFVSKLVDLRTFIDSKVTVKFMAPYQGGASLSEEKEAAIKEIRSDKYTYSEKDINEQFVTEPLMTFLTKKDYVSGLYDTLNNGYKDLLGKLQSEILAEMDKVKGYIADAKKLMSEADNLPDSDTVVARGAYRYALYNAANAQYSKLLGNAVTLAVKIMTADRASYVKLVSIMKQAEKQTAKEDKANAKAASAAEKANEKEVKDRQKAAHKKAEELTKQAKKEKAAAAKEEAKKAKEEQPVNASYDFSDDTIDAMISECALLEIANEEFMEKLFA